VVLVSGHPPCYTTQLSCIPPSTPMLDAPSHTQKLKAAFPIFLSDFPIELRQYPRGAEMPWHLDEQMYASPQWELIYTLDNTSDSRCAVIAATAAAAVVWEGRARSGVHLCVLVSRIASLCLGQLVSQQASQPASQQTKQAVSTLTHLTPALVAVLAAPPVPHRTEWRDQRGEHYSCWTEPNSMLAVEVGVDGHVHGHVGRCVDSWPRQR
jgi:hypothetical protein